MSESGERWTRVKRVEQQKGDNEGSTVERSFFCWKYIL